MSYSTLGDPWPSIKSAIKDLRNQPTSSVTVKYSFIIAGNQARDQESGGTATTVTIQNYNGTNSVNHTEFTTEITNSLNEWKAVFEKLFPGLTINFTNLGDETGTSIPSDGLYGNYSLTSGAGLTENIGDLRFGMHNIDGSSNVVGHGYAPGGVLGVTGNTGGDTHFDSSEKWRLDSQSQQGDISIKHVTVHEIGHNLGLGHDTNTNSIMYAFVSTSSVFSSQFPSGLDNSTPDLNAIDGIYNVDPKLWAINRRNKAIRRNNTSNAKPKGSSWTRVGSNNFRRISTSSQGDAYAIDRRQKVYRFSGNRWRRFSSGITHISLGNNSNIWAVNSRSKRIYKRIGGWTRVAGRMKRVAVGENGAVWAVDRRNRLYYRDGTTGDENTIGTQWILVDSSSRFRQISVGRDGQLWAIDRRRRMRFRKGITSGNPTGTGWTFLGPRFKQISANYSGRVYAITTSNKLYFRDDITLSNPDGRRWKYVSRNIRKIGVGLNV